MDIEKSEMQQNDYKMYLKNKIADNAQVWRK